MYQPLPAHTPNEGRYYLMVTACQSCGKGPWRIESFESSPEADRLLTLQVRCEHCGLQHTVRLLCESDSPEDGPSATTPINPTEQPSRIVDLAQWMGLFHMFLESAASANDKAVARRAGFQAAMSLAEALKFYHADNELPDESAFFTEKGLAIFRGHPEKFARQRLRDMQVKLPALPDMARHVARDQRLAQKCWWQFWKYWK